MSDIDLQVRRTKIDLFMTENIHLISMQLSCVADKTETASTDVDVGMFMIVYIVLGVLLLLVTVTLLVLIYRLCVESRRTNEQQGHTKPRVAYT